jgi:dihydrofolate reductase
MGKVIYSMSVSLDGFMEDADRSLDWVIIDEEIHRFFNDQAREAGAFLYGRRMYELMTAYWPTADASPSAPDFEIDYSRIWKEKPKIVFSKTLEKVEWNSRLVRDVVADEIRALKEQPDNDMQVGGPNLASAFMRLGLIDEYHVFVHPVVLGGGTPFFPALDGTMNFWLLETRTFGSGVVYLRYERR